MEMVLFQLPTFCAPEGRLFEWMTNFPQLVNPFGERIPVFINKDSINTIGSNHFKPTIFLDSNAVNYFARVYDVLKGKEEKRKIDWDLVDGIMASQFDLNIDFYCLECFSASESIEKAMESMRDVISKFLQLLNCDRIAFKNKRQLKMLYQASDLAFPGEKVNNFDDLAVVHIDSLKKRWETFYKYSIGKWELASKAMVLKTIILKNEKLSKDRMFELICEFEDTYIGVSFIREKIFSINYFSNSADARNLILKELNKKGFSKKIRGSVWDLLLPRITEKYFTDSLTREVILLPYIFSDDSSLIALSKSVQHHHAFKPSGMNGWTFALDVDHLKFQLKQQNQFSENIWSLLATSMEAGRNKEALDSTKLEETLAGLEEEAARILT